MEDPVGGRGVEVGSTTMGFSVENVAGVENISDSGFGEKVVSSALAASGLWSLMTLAEYHDSALLDISALQNCSTGSRESCYFPSLLAHHRSAISNSNRQLLRFRKYRQTSNSSLLSETNFDFCFSYINVVVGGYRQKAFRIYFRV